MNNINNFTDFHPTQPHPSTLTDSEGCENCLGHGYTLKDGIKRISIEKAKHYPQFIDICDECGGGLNER